MAKARNPNIDKAEKLYKQGNKLIDISNILNVAEGTIRSWKNRCNWDDDTKKNNATLQKNVKIKCNDATNKKSTKKEPKDNISIEVKEVIANEELTDKQKDFCFYYIKYRNQVTAYKKAYQCSYANACSHAYEVWNNVEVKKEIDKQLQEIRGNLKIDIQDLIKINMDIAFADMKDYTEWGKKDVEVDKDEDGNPIKVEVNYVDFKESSDVDGTLISEVKKGKDGVSIKLLDKGKAIDFLYKYLSFVSEEDKRKLEMANKQYQNKKLEAEIDKLKGDNIEIEDTGELEDEIYGNS